MVTVSRPFGSVYIHPLNVGHAPRADSERDEIAHDYWAGKIMKPKDERGSGRSSSDMDPPKFTAVVS
jgi:hypothetical protein